LKALSAPSSVSSASASRAETRKRLYWAGSSGFGGDFRGIGSIQGRNPTLVLTDDPVAIAAFIGRCEDRRVDPNKRNIPEAAFLQEVLDQAAASPSDIALAFPVYLPTLRQRMASRLKK
jgi:hypothetical protein